jgi:thiamine-phosphate pyrophosphorylase
MSRRQTMPDRWLILDRPNDESALNALRLLEQGSRVLVIGPVHQWQLRRMHRFARSRRLTIAMKARRQAARAHDGAELRRALLARAPSPSPIFATRSHPDWRAVPRMRAASLARVADRRLLALGGTDAQRYAIIAPLGFAGWAGISAFRT